MMRTIEQIRLRGTHHVTAVSDDGQGTIEIHADTPGLRPVKRSVNIIDRGTIRA